MTSRASVEPLLSVIVPTLGRPTLDEQLEALVACRWDRPWEVVLVDNVGDGAVARACDRWQERLPMLRWIDGSDRRSRSHAVNCGARAARGRWLLFVDDDDLVVPSIIDEVGTAFCEGARAVSFNMDLREVNPVPVWRSFDGARASETGRPMFRSIPALWGCSAIERQLFLDLGGYDEERLRAQDLDLTVRLHVETDVEPVWLPRQLVHYRLRGDARGRFRQQVDHTIAVQAISRAHPDLCPPLRDNRWSRLAKAAVRATPLALRATSQEGRLRLADRAGTIWGQFVSRGQR